jgi:ABC-type sugar transport system ATPase subunit
LPEVCDRVLIMAEGRVVKELAGAEMTRANIVQASYSEAPAQPQALSA